MWNMNRRACNTGVKNSSWNVNRSTYDTCQTQEFMECEQKSLQHCCQKLECYNIVVKNWSSWNVKKRAYNTVVKNTVVKNGGSYP